LVLVIWRADISSLYDSEVFEVYGQGDKARYKATKHMIGLEDRITMNLPRAVTKSQRKIDVY
jgi:lipopolysaccharide export system protein LptA